MVKILSKIMTILLVAILFLNMAVNVIYAAVEVSLDKAYIEKIGQAAYHLKYYREERKTYTYLVCSIVGYYDKDGNFNPSYCMNRDLVGAEDEAYYVKVESLLNNDKVWRVIKNGYPYKSAKELGLTSKYDAFAVTKFAVYCILGEAKLEYFKAESDDEEAVAMLKALKNLVNIGEKGTEKQQANPLLLTKVGDLKADGNYYSQEYKLTSTSEFNTFEISETTGIPTGAFIADISGSKSTKFKSGANFKIMIPKSQMTKDFKVKITVKAECKSYVILEGKTTVTKTQNYVVTAGEFATATTNASLEIKANNASININKIAQDSKIPIQGVKFELYDTNKKLVQTKQTDEDGKIKFENLYPGKYTLKETETNANYILDSNEQNVELEYNESKEVTIVNKRKTGKIKVYKVDKDNNELKIEGVKFDVYSEELKKVIGTYTTDKNGEINVGDLPTGEYRIIEKETNQWYNLADEVKLLVKYNETTESTIKNELKKGQVRVIKVDSQNSEIKIPGVKFEVQDKEGNVLETIETDKNGEAITSKYPLRDYDRIYLKEVETNQDYEINNEIAEVKLEQDQIKTIKVQNEKKKGNIKVYKVDKDNNEVKVEGARFDLYSEELNKVIGVYTTDKNGEINIENLRIGKYKIIERSTNKWYNFEEKQETIEVKPNETTELTITNEAKKGQVKVIKVDRENNEIKLQGVKFEVQDKYGNVLETLETDNNGEAITSKYPIKDYENLYLKEIETNEKYVLNEKVKKIKLEENKIKNITFENEKIKGKIKIIKTSKDDNKITGQKSGTPLEGVKFEIYNSENNILETLVTNKNGIATTSVLEKGEYKIKEIETNRYYYLNEDIVNATITTNKEEVTVNITNNSKNPDIDIEKNGPETAEVGGQIEYDISLRNTGNTSLDNFTMIDNIPYKYIDVTKFKTGTYNQDKTYDLYYKSNISGDYILLMEDLNSKENYEINFEEELADNEFLTEIKLEFGTVDIGFSSNENPHLVGIVKQDVKSKDTFTNIATVSGEFDGFKVNDKSKWKTVAYKLLPKTGF